jgi:hypothetical protein
MHLFLWRAGWGSEGARKVDPMVFLGKNTVKQQGRLAIATV